jgi:hypothetical protein
MYAFLLPGHTSLNYVNAEQRHRELLAEVENERRVALRSASASRCAAVLSAMRAGIQVRVLIEARVTDPEMGSPSQSRAEKPTFRQPD